MIPYEVVSRSDTTLHCVVIFLFRVTAMPIQGVIIIFLTLCIESTNFVCYQFPEIKGLCPFVRESCLGQNRYLVTFMHSPNIKKMLHSVSLSTLCRNMLTQVEIRNTFSTEINSLFIIIQFG